MKALTLLIFQARIRYKSRGVGSIIIQRAGREMQGKAFNLAE